MVSSTPCFNVIWFTEHPTHAPISCTTANLAVSLANMGFKVGVLDADIYGPSMPLMFDVTNEKPLAKNIDGVSKMIPVENFGVKLLSIGFFTKPDQAVIWRGPMAAKALNQMIFDAAWGELDFLLIDLLHFSRPASEPALFIFISMFIAKPFRFLFNCLLSRFFFPVLTDALLNIS